MFNIALLSIYTDAFNDLLFTKEEVSQSEMLDIIKQLDQHLEQMENMCKAMQEVKK